MKSICVVLMYRSFDVPEDMDMDKLVEEIEKCVEEKMDRFRVCVLDHPNEDEAEPIFDLDKVMVSDVFKISRG